MENWDEIRTAFQVARLGTVSGAAGVLGVHHATVIRHIDALETHLGVKLFQRHARGYTPTEAGQDLLRVAQITNDQFSQLAGRIKGQGNAVSGELVVTSLSSLRDVMVPVLAEFQSAHPDLTIRYLTGDRLFRLEYGEAHVAIRAGAAPEQPDNVVQPFIPLRVGLYASKSYIQKYGMPAGVVDFPQHFFAGPDNAEARAPFARWLRDNVPDSAITFRCSDFGAAEQAVLVGAAIGFINRIAAAKNPDLVEVIEPLDEWSAPLWLVTHVDLHRTTKVQSFLALLKERAKSWCPA
jgi:DNA-binding transcriptional LysR family regulator